MADCSNSTPVSGASIVTHPREQLRQLRSQLAEAAQRIIDALDAIDGDPDMEEEPDLEITCEDEGAQCDDEGFDSDREPEETDHWRVVPYVEDQTIRLF